MASLADLSLLPPLMGGAGLAFGAPGLRPLFCSEAPRDLTCSLHLFKPQPPREEDHYVGRLTFPKAAIIIMEGWQRMMGGGLDFPQRCSRLREGAKRLEASAGAREGGQPGLLQRMEDQAPSEVPPPPHRLAHHGPLVPWIGLASGRLCGVTPMTWPGSCLSPSAPGSRDAAVYLCYKQGGKATTAL